MLLKVQKLQVQAQDLVVGVHQVDTDHVQVVIAFLMKYVGTKYANNDLILSLDKNKGIYRKNHIEITQP